MFLNFIYKFLKLDRPDHVNYIEPGMWGLKTKNDRKISLAFFEKLTDQNKAEWHLKHFMDDKYMYEQLLFQTIAFHVKENVALID